MPDGNEMFLNMYNFSYKTDHLGMHDNKNYIFHFLRLKSRYEIILDLQAVNIRTIFLAHSCQTLYNNDVTIYVLFPTSLPLARQLLSCGSKAASPSTRAFHAYKYSISVNFTLTSGHSRYAYWGALYVVMTGRKSIIKIYNRGSSGIDWL